MINTLERNKRGELNEYSLSCGYLDKKERNGVEIRLFKQGCYHVQKANILHGKRIFWEVFDTRKSAYEFFRKNWKE